MSYSYNAPQYTDFQQVPSDDQDDYFDAKETDGNSDTSGKVPDDKENIQLSDEERSVLNDSFSKIKIKSTFEGIDLGEDVEPRKSHPMLTRQDITIMSPKLSLQLRTRSVLKDMSVCQGGDRLSKKRKAEGSPSQGNCIAKYRSLAEAIYHFQKDTPPRFRGVSKKSSGLRLSRASDWSRPATTVPETPQLLSGTRLRHCGEHCLSAEQRELEEIEHAKQLFKPQQLNKKIFEPPQEVVREKQFTVPKPFKLTKPPTKKTEESEQEVFVFKAKPIPSRIYGSTDNLRLSYHRLPVLLEEGEDASMCSSGVHGMKEAAPSHRTKVQPFSFDARDRLNEARKQEKINKILEEQKQATVFKAQPLPAYLAHSHTHPQPHCSTTDDLLSSNRSHHKCMDEVQRKEFRARRADVLLKKPFQVTHESNNTTKPRDIKLNTEKRAHERQDFNEVIKAHQEERERQMTELAEENEQKVQEEVAKLRKDLVHKPLPIPK